jgi:hypothetical protein
MLLASYVEGLAGTPRKQARYANPQSMDQAIRIALAVQEAEKQERFNKSFYMRFENSASPHGDSEKTRHSAPKRTTGHTGSKHPTGPKKATAQSTRNTQTKAALRCYECEVLGHFAKECSTRLRKEENCLHSTEKNWTERSRCSRSSREKPPFPATKESSRESRTSGNGN